MNPSTGSVQFEQEYSMQSQKYYYMHVTLRLLTLQNYIITQFQTKEVRLLTHLLQLLRT